MTAHSALGPSSAERWLNCPGSVALTKGVPDPGSAHSREGTVAHGLTEQLRLHGTLPAVGSIVIEDGHDIEVTQEMLSCVEDFVEYVEETPGERLVEVTVYFDTWVPEGFGTLDDARMVPRKATITDFKYGKGVQVFATDNSQLKLYALGVLQDWDWLYDFQEFVLCVHQPRLDHIDTWSISREDLLAWAETVVRPGAQATCRPDAVVKAGSWCQWCRIKTTCRVRAESVFRTVVGDFETIPDAVEKAATPRRLLTNDEVAVALTAIGNVKKWCAEVEAYAATEIQQGRAVGDFKLVAGRSNRAFVGEQQVVSAAMDVGVKVGDLYEKKLKTPAKLEKEIGKKHDLFKINGLVVKATGKPTLAPGSDPRPALVVDPTAEFDVMEEDE